MVTEPEDEGSPQQPLAQSQSLLDEAPKARSRELSSDSSRSAKASNVGTFSGMHPLSTDNPLALVCNQEPHSFLL